MAGERTLPGLGLTAFWTLGSNGYKTQLDENLRKLSALAQLIVINRVNSVPGSPVTGDIYLLESGANDKQVAVWDDGVWNYYVPVEGWILYSQAENLFVMFDGTDWVSLDASPRLPTFAGAGADANKTLKVDGTGTSYVLVAVPLLPSFAPGDALKTIRVNAAETAYELVAPAAGGSAFSVDDKTANYNTISADFGGNKLIRMNLAGANTITVDPSMALGEPLAVTQLGAGQTTIVAGAGVTLMSAGGALKLRVQHSVATIIKVAADTFLVSGDIEV